MKILSSSYTPKHTIRALKRLHKGVIQKKITLADLHRIYAVMLHLERYMDRLDCNKQK